MTGFAGGDISLPVEEPFGDLELSGVLHDGNDSLELIRVEFSGTGNQFCIHRNEKRTWSKIDPDGST